MSVTISFPGPMLDASVRSFCTAAATSTPDDAADLLAFSQALNYD
jgi:hypothetical protein